MTGTRVPLLLVIHGGPSGVSSDRVPPTRGAYPIPVFNGLGYGGRDFSAILQMLRGKLDELPKG